MTVRNSSHGTTACYWAGCRCDLCRAAVAARAREVSRLKAYGRWSPWADAAPVREHVRDLMASGIGYDRVARAAKVNRSTVARLLYGQPRKEQPPAVRLRHETAARLLAVRADPALLGDHAPVSACGSRRRLRALVACGWPVRRLAGQLGMTPEHASVIIDDAKAVEAATARRVRDLYDRLWDQPPPQVTRAEKSAAGRARARAVRNRWAPPLAWDDDIIDDPAARPHQWKRAQGSRLAAADVAELDRAGLSPAEIAGRTGATRAAVGRALSRARNRARAAGPSRTDRGASPRRAARRTRQAPGASADSSGKLSLPADKELSE